MLFNLIKCCHFLHRFLKISLPVGGPPVAVSFSDDASSLVVASQNLSGASLYMYGGVEKPKTPNESNQQSKVPLPEIKWEHHKIHEKLGILTLFGTTASYGTADGSGIIASCSEGTILTFYPALYIACMLFIQHVSNVLLLNNI